MGVTLMDGVLYIADSRNNAIRAVSVSTGKVTTVSGSGEAGSTDGKAKDARLSSDNNIRIWKLTHPQHNAQHKAKKAAKLAMLGSTTTGENLQAIENHRQHKSLRG